MRRQAAVGGMGHLIEVVADPPQLSEQRRLHPVDRRRRDFDLAVEHQHLAVRRQLHTRTQRLNDETRVVIIRHAEVDLSMTLLRLVRTRAGHFTPHLVRVRGAGSRSDRKGCRGRAERLSPAEMKRDLLANPHLATPPLYGICFVPTLNVPRLSYSQLHVVHCSNRQYVHLLEYAALERIMFSNVETASVQNYFTENARVIHPDIARGCRRARFAQG